MADAIAESIVTAAVRQKPDALVGVEVAVHTDCVFVDGRIAAGSQPVDIEKIVRDVYRAAGYGGSWNPDPGKIRVTTDLCQEVLSPEESDIRPFSDDQNIVIGYACGDERTNYLPAAHWISGELGRRLFARLRSDADLSATFGPDFKILASLEVAPGETQVEWRRLDPEHPAHSETALRAAAPDPLAAARADPEGLGGRRAGGSSFDLHPGQAHPQRGRGIRHRRPRGRQRAFGKEARYRPLRAGRADRRRSACGKDPHKVDKCGALRARQLAKKLVRGGVDEARVTLGVDGIEEHGAQISQGRNLLFERLGRPDVVAIEADLVPSGAERFEQAACRAAFRLGREARPRRQYRYRPRSRSFYWSRAA